MTVPLSSERVWEEIDKNLFAVLGMVTRKGEARTVGIVYVVDRRKLYIAAHRTAWKTKHIEANPHVSLTVAIGRRVPLMPWIKIPAATITFSGTARVVDRSELSDELFEKLYRHDQDRSEWCAIEVTPVRDFVTYGVGVSLLDMRFPDRARGRAPVSDE